MGARTTLDAIHLVRIPGPKGHACVASAHPSKARAQTSAALHEAATIAPLTPAEQQAHDTLGALRGTWTTLRASERHDALSALREALLAAGWCPWCQRDGLAELALGQAPDVILRDDLVARAQELEAEGVPATEIGPRLGRSATWWSVTRKRLGLASAPWRLTERLTVYCSAEEQAHVHDQAAAAGLSASDWLRQQAGLD